MLCRFVDTYSLISIAPEGFGHERKGIFCKIYTLVKNQPTRNLDARTYTISILINFSALVIEMPQRFGGLAS